ncbi:ess-2 splicing factor homolog isoform X1 [Lycorma delicatula]|uniref:ess-2 splicing factor homolog isoform X1 n=1 Tax=Lycorma delicatula TaxID=130591 RepID=UPI003F518BE4
MKEADTADIKSNKKKSSWELINILEEETYLENIGKIIERDFYPDLEKLRAQTDYLDAVEKNDVQKLREIYAKYSGKHPQSSRTTYDASPATFETPAERPAEEDVILTQNENDNSSGKSIQEDEGCKNIKLGLDQYLRTHTSEDNNSFQEMIQEAEAKNKHKYSWLYEAEEQSNSKIKELLSVPSIEEQAAGLERPLNVDTWNYKNKNYIMYVPDGKELTAAEKVELARGRQEIAHSNTRYQSSPFDENLNKETIQGLASNQARSLEGKIGVDGKELSNSTPRVNGYSFVKTPSPAPGVSESPLMTWGNIEGTPFRLDGGDTPLRGTPGPSFKIPEPPKREKLALALAEKAGQRHRDRKKKALQAAQRHLSSPSFSPSSGLDRLNSMSPAARNLASAQLRRVSSDRALQASYSPVSKSNISTPSPTLKSTPQRVRTPSNNQNLTDNLLQLNLPKRPKASDFF